MTWSDLEQSGEDWLEALEALQLDAMRDELDGPTVGIRASLESISSFELEALAS